MSDREAFIDPVSYYFFFAPPSTSLPSTNELSSNNSWYGRLASGKSIWLRMVGI